MLVSNLGSLWTNRGESNVEVARLADRHAHAFPDGAKLQSRGGCEPSPLCSCVSRLPGRMRYPGGIRDARAGRSVFPLCDRGISGPVWPGSQPTLAQAAAHGDFQAASACPGQMRSEEHTSELQSLMRISYAVFCL